MIKDLFRLVKDLKTIENFSTRFIEFAKKQTLEIEGREFSCLVIGQGEPVLLFHGFGVNSWWMLPVVVPHIHRNRFYIPTMRGHGGYEFGTHDPSSTIDQILFEDGKKLGEQLKVDFRFVVGHSLGVVSALGYLEKYGTKNTKYLHVDFPLNFSEDLEPIIEDLIESIKNGSRFKKPRLGGNLALLLDAVEGDFFRALAEMEIIDSEEVRLKEKYLELFRNIAILCLARKSILRKIAKATPLKIYEYFIPDYQFIKLFQRSVIWNGLNLKEKAKRFKGRTTVMVASGDGDLNLLNNDPWTMKDLREGFKDSHFIFFDIDSHMFHFDCWFSFQKHLKRFLEQK